MNACLCFYARSALTAIEYVIVAIGIQKSLELSTCLRVLLSKSVNKKNMLLKERIYRKVA